MLIRRPGSSAFILAAGLALLSADGCSSSGSGTATGGASGGGAAGALPLGLFDCYGCDCDGATHYCYEMTSGAGAGGLGGSSTGGVGAACPENSNCIPLPAKCGGTPDCSCLMCTCKYKGGGYDVVCNGGSAGTLASGGADGG